MNPDETDKELEVSLRAAFSPAPTAGRRAAKQSPGKVRLLRRAEHPPRNDTKKPALRLWAARLLIGVVVAWNLECALIFLLNPDIYAPGFELTGIPGAAAVRGFAVLFVMWNIPYLVALWNPRRHRLSLWEALTMQVVGLIGESLILAFIPIEHSILRTSLLRFIVFDAAGVVLLIGAVWLTRVKTISVK